MPTYVIGHKNPDTDAICSAIGYADFLRRTGMPEAEAACCGEIGGRTLFALERAGVPHPKLVLDVRTTAGQICHRDVVGARTDDSFLAAFDLMRQRDLRSIPVIDGGGRVTGMLSLFKLVDLLLPRDGQMAESRRVESSLARIGRGISGTFQNAVEIDREEELSMVVAALSNEVFAERLTGFDPRRLLVVMGNRPSVQRSAIDVGVRAIVLTGGNRLADDLLEAAKRRGVTVVSSPNDTATTTLLIKCSKAISHATSADFLSFPENTVLDHLPAAIENSPQSLFPVLDERQAMVGVFSKSDLIDPPRTKLVLVDHNEFNQAVHGAQQAEILEVIDHHRLGGGLSSRQPIRFVNEPVGSTSTIVARFFRQAGLTPEPAIALALAAGMISDTLFLTSPTTTPVDREILEWLGKVSKTDLKQFAADFFAAGSVLVHTTPDKAIRADCKQYEENGWKIAVAQIEEQGLDNFWKQRAALTAALSDLRREQNLDFVCLLVTDIGTHDSVMLTDGREEIVKCIDYPKLETGLYELAGIVSRKKQLLPHLILTLHKARKES